MDNKLGRRFNFIRHGAIATMQLKANGTELWVEEYCIQKFSEPRSVVIFQGCIFPGGKGNTLNLNFVHFPQFSE